ncbi:hypothetical protein WJX72_003626 [[Myrmecia] bisecta]|uniref:Transcription initiation factor TFIID subunit 2 n=1 Tax=[Myrmecia] bisecta TaxID=41462 RepID=A0AAW1PAS4_9CHLO
MNTTLPRVLHQSLSLTVDTNKQLLRGHTELKLSCSAHVRNIGVHAYKLNVTAVTVNGEEASYGLRPYVGEELPESIQKGPYESAQQAAANVADHTYFQYEGMLQKEAEPELVIQLPASMQSAHSAATQGGLLILGGAQRELLVRIQYDVAQPQSGMHFAGEYAHTDNQVRRARAWLPCVDTPTHACPFDLHLTVGAHQIFSLYETFLGEKFPYGMLQQAFIPAEAASNPSQVAAGMHLFSTDLLFNERCIEQAIESRCAIAKALARQWFGVFIRPKTAGDAWLLEGLAGYLADQYVRRFMGRNEWLYRKHKERKAIFLADDGSAPHLFLKGLDIYHWGLLYGTERLDPSGLRAWKATAVMNMLAVRAGEDNLRKVMRNIMSAACKQSPTGDGQTDGNARLISTREFLHNVGKQGGCRKEVGAFGERWIVGRGCPRITAAFAYNKRANLLEVAARQEGSLAARKTTEKANTAALREGSSIGLIKLAVRETDGLAEHTIQIGTQRYSLAEEIKVTSKPGARKMKKRGGQEEDLPEEASRTPILWVRLDPSGETLADIHMYQPEFMWAAQLGMSRDVVAQSLAIRGLAEMRPASPGVLNILRSCLENDMVYCRIRIEAAMALAHSRGDGHRSQGLDHLIAYFRQRCFDPEVQQIRPNRFEDLAEHFVSQALPVAISLARHPSGHSPPEAVDLLVDVAKYEDNRGNIYDDSNFLAAIVQALGNLRPSSREALMRIVKQLDRLLAREQVLPSFHSVVASAVLSALTQLATSATAHGARELVPGLMRLFTQFTLPSVHHSLRRTAYRCCVQLTASTAGLDAAVQLANDAVAAEPLPAVRSAILEDLLQVQLTLTISPALTSNASAEVSMATLVQLQQRLTAHDDPRLRHRAFMVLQRLAGAPPTLFREKEDEEPSMAGPSMSLDTRQRGRPEASAPALSMDSERVVLRLKPGKTGTQMSPSPHKGRASEGGSDERTVAGGEVRSPLQPTPPARVVQRTDSPTRLKIRTTPESGPSGAAKPIIARFSLKPSGSLSGGLPPAGAAPSLSAGTPAAGAVQRSSDGARTQSPGQAATYKTQSAGEAAPEAAVDQLPAPVQPGPSVAHRSHVQELGRQPLADQPAAAETPRLGRIVLKHGQGFAGSPAVPAAAVGPASAAGVQAGPSVKAEGQPQAKPEVDASGSVFTFGTGSVPAGIPAGPPFTMGQPEQKAARHNPKATSRKSKMPPVAQHPQQAQRQPGPTFSVGAVSGSDSGKRKREMTADQLTEYKRAKKEGKDKRKQEETEEEKAERRRLKKAKKDRKGRERSGSAIEQI